jgi:hypothetical protein
MLKCGIIGFGKMGQIRAKALENSGQAIITAVYDITEISDCAYPVVENEVAVINADVDAVFVVVGVYNGLHDKPWYIISGSVGLCLFLLLGPNLIFTHLTIKPMLKFIFYKGKEN